MEHQTETGPLMQINRTEAASRARVSTLLALALASSAALSVLPAASTPTGHPVLRSVIVTGIGAVQLICLGLLGEYVARIFTTVQGRPTSTVGYDSLEQAQRDAVSDDAPAPSAIPRA